MKLATSQKIHEGPWGGGNNFNLSLKTYLEHRGHTVVQSLDDRDIDIILLTDPRFRNPNLSYVAGHVLRYLMFKNPNAIVVQRINECDARKNTRTMDARLKMANYCADHTVFIATWLRDLDVWRKSDGAGSSVILNGADTEVFNDLGYAPWNGTEPLKLVTHHWGGNRMKGFDVYEQLDALLGTPKWRGKIDFTYIGNLPQGFAFKNANHLSPMSGHELATTLRQHHAYVTASINEPAGMHHIEGALCGMPLLYRESGALPEYCSGFGEPFSGPKDFEPALSRMLDNYAHWRSCLPDYSHTAEHMAREYFDLFTTLLEHRDDIIAKRRIWRDPLALFLNQLPL